VLECHRADVTVAKRESNNTRYGEWEETVDRVWEQSQMTG
jgi:hypothetical protein